MVNELWSGTVIIDGHPICDTNWDNNDAYAACRSLGFPRRTKAFAHQGAWFGQVQSDYLIGDVSCGENVNKLSLCSLKTAPTCSANQQAGVTCLDPTLLTVDENFTPKLAAFHFCATGWAWAESQALCNTLSRDKFMKRGGVVPVFKTTSSHLVHDHYISDVRCTGQEESITQCAMGIEKVCDVAVAVQCAKCTPETLLEIVEKVSSATDTKTAKEGLDSAKQQLAESCHDWYCGIDRGEHGYDEYCKVKSFLVDVETMLKRPLTRPILDVETDYKKQLEHMFIKSEMNKLHSSMSQIRAQLTDFQTGLADYFDTMAQFNERAAKSDYDVVVATWADYEKELQKLSGQLNSTADLIINGAIGSLSVELAMNVAKVFFGSLSVLKNPLEPGEMADSIIQMMDLMGDLVKTGNDLGEIPVIVDAMKVANQHRRKMVENFDKNKEHYHTMEKIVKVASGGPIDLDACRRMVDESDKITSTFLMNDYVIMKEKMDYVLDKSCELLRTGESANSQYVQTYFVVTGACPRAKEQLALMDFYFTKLGDLEDEYNEVLRSIASAKLAQAKAQELGDTLKTSLNDDLDVHIVRFESFIMLRNHKLQLISDACNKLTYINGGLESATCTKLLENPDGNFLPVISNVPTMCRRETQITKVVSIPVGVPDPLRPLPPGTINIQSLMGQNGEKGSTIFQIPNNQWLVDNDWLHEDVVDQFGPFFIKEFSVIPPFVEVPRRASISAQLTMIDNGFYKLKKRVYLRTEILTRAVVCRNGFIPNPYNLPQCPHHLEQLCLVQRGWYGSENPQVAEIYPSVNATWRLTFDLRRVPDPKPYPTTPMFIKAEVTLCSTHNMRNGMKQKAMMEKRNQHGGCCNKNQGYYLSLLAEFQYDNSPCKKCPEGSSPSYFGSWCEKCPLGLSRKPEQSFGCS